MNAVIYARYSSDNQREESIDGQLRECKEYADQNGITVVRTYIDRALSAKTDSRPQFQQMIHDSATHTFEAVLVWKLDRFSRNRYDSAHYKRILKNNRVHVVSVTEPISNTPEGIMLESLLEGMAEYYSAELAEKVSRGHKENALKAKFNGGPVPLGYRIDSQHHYQIDPATAPVVQEAFQRYAAGESIRSIIESLNARGIRNSRGNPFTKNSFQTLLKNRRYLGEYRYKDTVIPNAIPAIIAPECFDAVQRRCEIHRQAPAHNKSDVHYLLTTKLFCGKCGTMMAGESGRSHTGTVHCYYRCGTRKRSGREACSLKPVRKEPLEQFVVQTALEKVLNDRVVDLLVDKLLEYQSRENTRLPVLQAELKEVKRRIDNLVAAIEQGILTPSTRARMDELEQQREALETSVLQEQIEKPPITREQILFWFDQFRHGDPADMAFQEKVIDCFVNSIYLFDDRIVLNFNYQEGGRPVSLEEVLGSFLDGRGAPADNLTRWRGVIFYSNAPGERLWPLHSDSTFESKLASGFSLSIKRLCHTQFRQSPRQSLKPQFPGSDGIYLPAISRSLPVLVHKTQIYLHAVAARKAPIQFDCNEGIALFIRSDPAEYPEEDVSFSCSAEVHRKFPDELKMLHRTGETHFK